jgi:hypothetical protein
VWGFEVGAGGGCDSVVFSQGPAKRFWNVLLVRLLMYANHIARPMEPAVGDDQESESAGKHTLANQRKLNPKREQRRTPSGAYGEMPASRQPGETSACRMKSTQPDVAVYEASDRPRRFIRPDARRCARGTPGASDLRIDGIAPWPVPPLWLSTTTARVFARRAKFAPPHRSAPFADPASCPLFHLNRPCRPPRRRRRAAARAGPPPGWPPWRSPCC